MTRPSHMAPRVKSQPEVKQWSRQNGWSFPLHLLQLLAWLFLVMFSLLYFGVLVPSLPSSNWRIASYAINGLIFFGHIVVHLASISLNPADPNVRAKNYQGPLPEFNREQHRHVIENQFCYICEVKVGMKSKHCSACNKCVSGFDHHCKWLNNCIGDRNYRLFIVCVTTALIGCLIIMITSVVLVTAFFLKDSWLNNPHKTLDNLSLIQNHSMTQQYWHLNSSNETFNAEFIFYVFFPVTGVLWLVVVILTLGLSFLAVCLLIHLLGFHFYLMCIGLSTYDYIVRRRDSIERVNDRSCSEICRGKVLKEILSKKGNQISPTSDSNTTTNDLDDMELKSTKRNKKNSELNELSEATSSSPPSERERNQTAETTLESMAGDVYLGSPLRHGNVKQNAEKQNEIFPVEEVENKETRKTQSSSNLTLDFTELALGPNPSRKRHLSASPALHLPPIMETDIPSEPDLSLFHRSVSAQSLNQLSDREDSISDLSSRPGLEQKHNSSLSNLLVSLNESLSDGDKEKVESSKVSSKETLETLSSSSDGKEDLGTWATRVPMSGEEDEMRVCNKNNHFQSYRPATNSAVILIGNDLNDKDSMEVTVFDSIVFNHQSSIQNSTPIV